MKNILFIFFSFLFLIGCNNDSENKSIQKVKIEKLQPQYKDTDEEEVSKFLVKHKNVEDINLFQKDSFICNKDENWDVRKLIKDDRYSCFKSSNTKRENTICEILYLKDVCIETYSNVAIEFGTILPKLSKSNGKYFLFKTKNIRRILGKEEQIVLLESEDYLCTEEITLKLNNSFQSCLNNEKMSVDMCISSTEYSKKLLCNDSKKANTNITTTTINTVSIDKNK